MEAAYVSAVFGLAGAVIGGLTSFVTTWLTQRAQIQTRHIEAERALREGLFDEFIMEASRLYGDALGHEKDDVTDLVRLYALVGRMRLVSSPAVVGAAEKTLSRIIVTYLAPNRTLHELHLLANNGDMDFLLDFGKACRAELIELQRHPMSTPRA